MIKKITGFSVFGGNPGEFRWVFWFALIVMLVTSLPYLAGYTLQGPAWRFSGFVFAVEDGNSYIADMQTGAVGQWLFQTPYTALAQNGMLIFLHYIVLGKLAAPPGMHDQLVVLYHLFRCVSGVLAILATYDFLALFLSTPNLRRWGTVLVTLGGGLGWAALLSGGSGGLNTMPLEFYSPETFQFLALFGLAHLASARAFFLWGLRSYLLALQEQGQGFWWGSVRTGILWLFTALAQPLTGMIVGAAAGIHLLTLAVGILVEKKVNSNAAPAWQSWRGYFSRALVAGAIAAPFIVYNALAFTLDPFLRIWNEQSAIPSPSPWMYLLAYGLILPFAAVGAVKSLRMRGAGGIFLPAWILFALAAVYLPYSQQRRLLEGVWVAWVALAGIGLERNQLAVLDRPGRVERFKPVLLFSFLPTALLFAGSVLQVSQPSQPAYEPAAQVAAFQDLAARASVSDVVLSAYTTGNALPAWAPVRVVLGLGTLTAHSDALKLAVPRFFKGETGTAERQALISEQHVRYVFWGPEERSLGDWDPNTAAYLQPVYGRDGYMIFEVTADNRSR
jgi:hypothetical protein